MFHEKIQTESNVVTINIENNVFELIHVKSEDNSTNGNKLYLCAHNRLVEIKDLDKYITDLDREIYKNSKFWYIGVLKSRYLDEHVDMNRLSFNIPEEETLESGIDNITMRKIMDAVIVEVSKFLGDYLKPISENKLKRIREYVTNKAPQFRHLLKYMPDQIANIKPNLSDDKLDDELHRIKRDFDRNIAKEKSRLYNHLMKGIINTNAYHEAFIRLMEKISSANASELAQYIVQRKVIIDFLEFAIKQQDDDKFKKESFLHNLIYPMRSTADDMPYVNHNLWLIDEKLAYCSYISSDIPFDNCPKEKRADLMILDCPVAVSDEENRGREYGTIVLFELKRPMRNDYDGGNNPVNQLYEYVARLKKNNVTDKDGRIIRVGESTQFYLYAVCDITSTLESVLINYDFTQTPDKMGYYRYNERMNAYIEILSYDKIISDAHKRNKILFDKLGL